MMLLFQLEHNHSYLWFFLKTETAWFSNTWIFQWANVSEKEKEQGRKKEKNQLG